MAQTKIQEDFTWVADGENSKWREFLCGQIPRLYGLFISRWPNPSLAEELIQRTVFDAVRGRKTFSPQKGNPEQWISGIARNHIRLEIKRRSTQSHNGDLSAAYGLLDSRALPDEILEQKETAQLVIEALEKLEERQRFVLQEKYIQQRTAAQIAVDLKITEKAVHSLLYRARLSLAKQLKSIGSDRGLL